MPITFKRVDRGQKTVLNVTIPAKLYNEFNDILTKYGNWSKSAAIRVIIQDWVDKEMGRENKKF